MEYKDLHPLLRLQFFFKRRNFTSEDYASLTRVYGPFKKGELPPSCLKQFRTGILCGVATVVFIAAFNLWYYSVGLIALAWIITEVIPLLKKRADE